MGQAHAQAVKAMADDPQKVETLMQWAYGKPGDIPDPYGQSVAVYLACAQKWKVQSALDCIEWMTKVIKSGLGPLRDCQNATILVLMDNLRLNPVTDREAL